MAVVFIVGMMDPSITVIGKRTRLKDWELTLGLMGGSIRESG